MLLADNTALADALTSEQTIELGYVLWFDWNRDGTFTDPYADFSTLVVEPEQDAQFTGQYPAEYEVNDGYAQRRFTITVAGTIGIGADAVDAVTFFSAYAGFYGGSIGAINTPCRFAVVINTADGPVEIPQGERLFLLHANPHRAGGSSGNTVTLELGDITSQLTNPITFAPSARSQVLAQWGQSGIDNTINERMRQRGGNSLSWYLLHALRQCGLYQGPRPPDGCVAYWTLAGGVLPEVGGMGQMPRDGRQSWPINNSAGTPIIPAITQSYNELPRYAKSFNDDPDYPAGPWSPDIDTPNTYPRYMWTRSEFGPLMRYDVYDPDTAYYGGNTDLATMVGSTSAGIRAVPTTSSVANRIYVGGWIVYDSTISTNNQTGIQCVLTGFASVTETSAAIAYCELVAFPSRGELQARLVWEQSASTGRSWTTTLYGYDSLTDGNHYVAACFQIQLGKTPVITLQIDHETITVPLDPDSSTAELPANTSTYLQVDGRDAETSPMYLYTSGGAQHWGIWTAYNVAPDSAIRWSNHPDYLPEQISTDIGPSMARVLWTPTVDGKQAWNDVIKEIGSADLGVIYTTEDGVLRYTNWEDILLARDTGRTTSYLSLADVQALDPSTTFDSVANMVTYSSQDKWFVDDVIVKATNAQQFQVASGREARFQTTVDDAMSVLPGSITPRRLAQGYWASGDNPGNTTYTWQDFVRAYAPDNWKNGFAAHNRGDVTGAGQPPEGIGVFAYATSGWAPGDTDPRHVTIVLRSANAPGGRTSAMAVDDTTPFLNIRGYRIVAANQVDTTVTTTDTESLRFGPRVAVRPQSDWASDYDTQHDLSQMLADELAQPRPVFDTLDVRLDPRRQLQDVVAIRDPGGIGGPIYATVVGIHRNYAAGTETLTLRTFGPRGGSWLLDDPDLSLLDRTTILG